MTHDLLEEQNVAAEISEQLEIETKERLKLKEEYEYEKERAIELEKVRKYKKCIQLSFELKKNVQRSFQKYFSFEIKKNITEKTKNRNHTNPKIPPKILL